MSSTTAGTRIVGTGYHLPADTITNTELSHRLGVEPDWIVRRTGIRERRRAAVGETVADLAVHAGRAAITHSGVGPGAVDAVIVATSTAPTTIPSTAAAVAHRLGLRQPAAYDLNTACAGFCYAVANADALIRSGTARTILVIGADKSTDWVDYGDVSTAILFGDGAGAAVLTASRDAMVGPVTWGSIGSQGHLIGISSQSRVLEQDGRAVFRWASGLAPVAQRVCARSGLSPRELMGFVPHQANVRIIDAIARGLDLSSDAEVARDVIDCGNTIAATVPISLARLVERGVVGTGPVLLFGFGAGLSYAGQVVRLG